MRQKLNTQIYLRHPRRRIVKEAHLKKKNYNLIEMVKSNNKSNMTAH